MNTTTSKRTIRHPEKWIGKRLDLSKWQLPTDYTTCRWTGEVMHVDAGVSWPDYLFDWGWLTQVGLNVEGAEYLSERGYDQMVERLNRLGVDLYHKMDEWFDAHARRSS